MKGNSKLLVLLTLALLAQLALEVARGAEPDAAGGNGGAIGAVAVDSATSMATVLAIDPQQRTVTLRTEDGSEATFHASPEVINFDQIKVGDQVKATRIDALAVFARKPGAPSEGAARTVALAPKGAMPGAFMAETLEVTAKVVGIDQHTRQVTIEGPNGEPQTIHVGPKIDLAAIHKGDDVVVRFTQGLLIRVERGPSSEGAQVAGEKLPSAIAVATINADAKVTAIDKKRRSLTLLCADGSQQTFTAGKDVENFDQIQVGDEVKATLIRTLAIDVRKPGTPSVEGGVAEVALAPRGSLPGAVMVNTAEVTDKIDAIDQKTREITLETPDGIETRIIHVSPRVDLSGLAKGDEVVVRYTDGLVLRVEK